MPVANAISFLCANRHCKKSSPRPQNPGHRQKPPHPRHAERCSNNSSTTACCFSIPLPLDSSPIGCLDRLSPQPVSQWVTQSVSRCVSQTDRKLGTGWGLRIHVAAACMVFCLKSYREADMEEAEVTGSCWGGHDSASAASSGQDGRGAAYHSKMSHAVILFLHLYSRCTRRKDQYKPTRLLLKEGQVTQITKTYFSLSQGGFQPRRQSFSISTYTIHFFVPKLILDLGNFKFWQNLQ